MCKRRGRADPLPQHSFLLSKTAGRGGASLVRSARGRASCRCAGLQSRRQLRGRRHSAADGWAGRRRVCSEGKLASAAARERTHWNWVTLPRQGIGHRERQGGRSSELHEDERSAAGRQTGDHLAPVTRWLSASVACSVCSNVGAALRCLCLARRHVTRRSACLLCGRRSTLAELVSRLAHTRDS